MEDSLEVAAIDIEVALEGILEATKSIAIEMVRVDSPVEVESIVIEEVRVGSQVAAGSIATVVEVTDSTRMFASTAIVVGTAVAPALAAVARVRAIAA